MTDDEFSAARIKAYRAAVEDSYGAARRPDPETGRAAAEAVAHAYRNLTREDCARLWPGSPESRDPARTGRSAR